MIKKALFFFYFFGIISTSFAQNKEQFAVIKKPVTYDNERVKLSIEYLKEHHGLEQSTPSINPKIIVLHYTAGGTLKSNFNYFNNTHIESGRGFNKKQSLLNVSAHYLVDRDGSIYNIIPDTIFARHTIGLNYCAIGVENIGSKSQPLTDKQVQANAYLVRKLTKEYNIKYLIGHSEYGIFKKSSLWKELNPNYFTHKSDPGDSFMLKVRKLVADLDLKDKP